MLGLMPPAGCTGEDRSLQALRRQNGSWAQLACVSSCPHEFNSYCSQRLMSAAVAALPRSNTAAASTTRPPSAARRACLQRGRGICGGSGNRQSVMGGAGL